MKGFIVKRDKAWRLQQEQKIIQKRFGKIKNLPEGEEHDLEYDFENEKHRLAKESPFTHKEPSEVAHPEKHMGNSKQYHYEKQKPAKDDKETEVEKEEK